MLTAINQLNATRLLGVTEMKRLCLVSYLLLCLLFGFSFSYYQEIETRNGVRIVHNGSGGMWGLNPQVTLQLIRSIGGIDVEDENLAFKSPYDMCMDKEGNLYILDSRNACIIKLDSKGNYLKTIGRKGQGPGEFQGPFTLDIDADGYLYVSDVTNKRIHILNRKGKEQKTIKIKKYRVQYAGFVKPGYVVVGGLSNLIPPKEKQLPKLLQVFNLRGKLEYEFGDMFDYKDNWVSLWANWFYFDVDEDGYFYLTFRHQNRVEKYTPEGILLWQADRKLSYGTEPMDKGLNRQIPKMNTVSEDITVDSEGRIWVLTQDRQFRVEEEQMMISGGNRRLRVNANEDSEKTDVYKLEIFDGDGILLGEIHLNHHAHGMRIVKNYLFIWERNNAKIYQYELT